jgi:hypothetical protein
MDRRTAHARHGVHAPPIRLDAARTYGTNVLPNSVLAHHPPLYRSERAVCEDLIRGASVRVRDVMNGASLEVRPAGAGEGNRRAAHELEDLGRVAAAMPSDAPKSGDPCPLVEMARQGAAIVALEEPGRIVLRFTAAPRPQLRGSIRSQVRAFVATMVAAPSASSLDKRARRFPERSRKQAAERRRASRPVSRPLAPVARR